jgi:hypothetical protein
MDVQALFPHLFRRPFAFSPEIVVNFVHQFYEQIALFNAKVRNKPLNAVFIAFTVPLHLCFALFAQCDEDKPPIIRVGGASDQFFVFESGKDGVDGRRFNAHAPAQTGCRNAAPAALLTLDGKEHHHVARPQVTVIRVLLALGFSPVMIQIPKLQKSPGEIFSRLVFPILHLITPARPK